MKHLYTRLSILLSGFVAIVVLAAEPVYSQNPIPNPGFEEWSGGEPVGWNTINQSILGTSFICVTRDQTNPQSGTSCARIETITHNIILVGPVTMPGILSLGEITIDIINQTGTVSGGVPVDNWPVVLKGWFRYEPAAGDSCILGIGLSKWNGSGRDTLATSYKVIGGQNPDWQQFEVPIDYLIWEMPDTMNVMLFSSNLLNGSPVTGSKLWIDSLYVEYGQVSVPHRDAKTDLTLNYDNEGNPVILQNEPVFIQEIEIYNLNGACAGRIRKPGSNHEIHLNTAGLSRGLYLVRVLFQNGSFTTLKFIRH